MSGRFWKFLLIFLVALLVFGVVGVVISFAVRDNHFGIAVEYNDNIYYSSVENQNIYLSAGMNEFAVNSKSDYTVKIVSVADSNFVFSVDGKMYQLYGTDEDNNDYTSAFGLQIIDDGFTVVISDSGIERVLQNKFGGEIKLESKPLENLPYFAILVMSGKDTLYLPFTFAGQADVNNFGDLILDPPHVIF